MFFAISGAIFLGGAGSVIIGGLYWKKGTTAAAWSAMIIGAVMATTGVIIESVKPDFPLTGMEMYGVTIATSLIVYILVSLLWRQNDFDLDRMLHRGKYAIAGESSELPAVGFKALFTKEFTKNDKRIYIAVIIWTLGWFGVFVVGTTYGLLFGLSDQWWGSFWKWYIYVSLALGIVTTIWFIVGGMFDVTDIIKLLTTIKRNPLDDGRVVGHQNLADKVLELSQEHKT